MKLYFRKNDKGELELVKDPKVGEKYLNEKGEELVCEAEKSAAIITGTDAIKELTGLIKDMASDQNRIKEEMEKQKDAIKAYQESMASRFPLPGQVTQGAAGGDGKLFYGYDLVKQGRELTNKFAHPFHVISDEKREHMAKYFCLVLRSSAGDLKALGEFNQLFGKADLGSPAQGATFIVPDIVEAEILAFARERSLALQYGRIVEMISEKDSFPAETASSSISWLSPTTNASPQSDPTVAEVELTAYELSAYTAARNAFLADTRSDIVSWLMEMMAEAAGLELDNAMFNGDGTSTYGYCSGILSAQAGYSVTMGAGSTAFSNLTADHLSEMISKLDGLKKIGARFCLNGVALHFVRSLKDSNDRPIFIETVGSPVSGTIWGFPYSEAIKAPSTSAANTAFISFGNLRYFFVGRRLETTTLQLDPWGLWTTNRTRFKLYQRWGLKIGQANGFVRLLTHS